MTPLVVYLCSEACEETHADVRRWAAGATRESSSGWRQAGRRRKASRASEEIQANFAQIHEPGDYEIPSSIAGEMQATMKALAD